MTYRTNATQYNIKRNYCGMSEIRSSWKPMTTHSTHVLSVTLESEEIRM